MNERLTSKGRMNEDRKGKKGEKKERNDGSKRKKEKMLWVVIEVVVGHLLAAYLVVAVVALLR